MILSKWVKVLDAMLLMTQNILFTYAIENRPYFCSKVVLKMNKIESKNQKSGAYCILRKSFLIFTSSHVIQSLACKHKILLGKRFL